MMNILSLCAGYGGLEQGFQQAIPNSRVVAISEIEAFAVANLISKMEKGIYPPAPIWTDLRTFPYAEFSGRVDAVTAGFPCQPFSTQSVNRVTTDDPRHLFPNIMQGVEQMGYPSVLFFENVRGILGQGKSGLASDTPHEKEGDTVLFHCCRQMERIGYRTSWIIVDAREVGCPMKRARVFILGIHSQARDECLEDLIQASRSSRGNQSFDQVFDLDRDAGDLKFSLSESQLSKLRSRSTSGLSDEALHPVEMFEYFTANVNPQSPVKQAYPKGRTMEGDQYAWEPNRWVRRSDYLDTQADVTDSMALLGNGVVPEMASYALLKLLSEFQF